MTVEADPSAPNVLRQSGSGTFPWCMKTGTAVADGFVEVKFKPENGRHDQAGGLIWRNTMVFTHIPASLCLIGAAFASSLELALGLLLVRSLLSQMDVPARSAYVMSVVTPPEPNLADYAW